MHDTEMTKIHQEKILVGYNEGVSPPMDLRHAAYPNGGLTPPLAAPHPLYFHGGYDGTSLTGSALHSAESFRSCRHLEVDKSGQTVLTVFFQ